jgi:outer membrane protein TolC
MIRRPLRMVWLCAALTGLAPPAFAQPLTLDEAQRIAQSRAPLLAAARAQEAAAREMAVAVGQLPDPVLKVGVNNVPVSGEMAFSLVQEGMTMRSVALMQEFTRGDKRQARSERARREAELALVQQRQTLADTRRETALAWLDLAYQERMRGFIEAQLAELDLQQQAAESAFRTGKGEQADIFANRLASERTRDQLAQMQRDIAMARSRLARWLGEDELGMRPLAAPPDLNQLAWRPDLLNDAASSHPTLAAQAGQVALAEADARLARENRKPDVSVELMVSQRGPSYPNMVSLNFSMPLPWDRANRQDRELGAKLAQLDQARAVQDDMRRAYIAELRGNLAAWQSNRERVQRYDEVLIPLARQQTEAALAAYRAGSGMLARVLEARRMAIDTQMERQRVALDAARAWAQLNFLNPQGDQASAARGDQP